MEGLTRANVKPAVIPEWDCLKCGLCVEVCPKKALAFNTKKGGKNGKDF